MATYVPNATNATEPTSSRTVDSAAEEFRTLKNSVNSMRQWLGASTTAPTTDTLGNPLSTGDFYYNSAQYNFYIYDATAARWRTFQTTATSSSTSSFNITLDQNTPDILNLTMSSNTTITDALPAGANILLSIANPSNYTMTWPASIKWVNGSVPTLLTYGVVFVNIFKNSGNLYGIALGGAN